SAGRIVSGDRDASSFFTLLGPDGPMYRVFSDADIAVWRQSTRSLAGSPAPAAVVTPAPPAAAPTADPGAAMLALVETMRPRQQGVSAHAGTMLTGPDPEDAARTVTNPVAWWFGQPTRAFLVALSNPANDWVTPGSAEDSRLVTSILRGRNAMARALGETLPGTTGTGAEVVTRWIDAG